MDSCLIRIDLSGAITAMMGTSTSGQAHETLVSTVVGEILEREPDSIRVLHADSLNALPSNSPVGSRMAIMLGGAAAGAAKILKKKLIAIAAHNLEIDAAALSYVDGDVIVTNHPDRRLSWDALVEIAHRHYHRMPRGSSRDCRRSSSGRCRPAVRYRPKMAASRCTHVIRSSRTWCC